MRRSMILATAAVMASGLLLAGCGSDTPSGDSTESGDGGGTTPKVGVILPDTKSSARWETADAKYLEEAFTLRVSSSTSRTPRATSASSRRSPTR